MTKYKGKLYLIPAPLGDNPVEEVIPAHVLNTACALKCFVVEELRTARRFLSKYGLQDGVTRFPATRKETFCMRLKRDALKRKSPHPRAGGAAGCPGTRKALQSMRDCGAFSVSGRFPSRQGPRALSQDKRNSP